MNSPRETPTWVLWGVLALFIAVYSPILYYMALHWKIVPDYSHGFLIVPLAIYFAWQRKPLLEAAKIGGTWWGLVPLALGLAALAVGRLGVELMAMRTGFVVSLIGMVLLLFGLPVFRILIFPLLFLFLMVPLPQALVNVVAFPLQLIAADAAVQSLHVLRVPALLEGNIIHLANAELFVDQACSGLRSLMALITLGVVFAYFFRQNTVERVIIVLSAIPVAILVNAFRVALTGILTYRYGEQAAGGAIHEFQGLITFGTAFLLLMVEARVMDWIRLWRKTSTRSAERLA
ncbi:MAG: exosortase/archaeosortase family protein [Proteobacteria bacterium]|nr:exosortase/archaeosortase family protein [Pseudomonadota bacterium]